MDEHKTNAVAIMADTRPKCGTCMHFFLERPGAGHCRLNPPVPFVAVVPTGKIRQQIQGPPLQEMQEVVSGRFAPVAADTWCGRHPDFSSWVVSLGPGGLALASLDAAEARGRS